VSELTDININDLKVLKEAYRQVTYYAAADQIGKFVTDEMVEKFSYSGTSEHMIQRIEEIRREVGIRHFGIYPVPPPHEDRESMTRRFTEEVMSKF
jgi:alkanesulfonate monooxygenase SsuD/methylene tetrahydromethanopterin reductase-like flavin-dependent oxidoreductase (luciferase family)